MLQIALPLLKLKERLLLPIVQGGMGVGISAHRLAGTVAKFGAVGTISSVDLRRHHPDLMAQTGGSRDKQLIDSVNLIALDICNDTQLAFAMNGDIKRGLFFRGSEELPFGSAIRSVWELMQYMLTGQYPADLKVRSPEQHLLPS